MLFALAPSFQEQGSETAGCLETELGVNIYPYTVTVYCYNSQPMSRFANKLDSRRRGVLRMEYRQGTAEVSEANEVLEDVQGMPSVADAEEAYG